MARIRKGKDVVVALLKKDVVLAKKSTAAWLMYVS